MLLHTTPQVFPKPRTAVVAVLSAILSMGTAPAWAEKPQWAGGPHKERAERFRQQDHDQGERRRGREHRQDRDPARHVAPVVVRPGGYFDDRHRTVVHEYYAPQWRAGHCPPGLAKKNNGCMPPGQAKKWHMGQRLPTTVRYYAVPQPLLVQLGPAPTGYRYVRVDDDILLLATATRLVVDAIQGMVGR